MHGGKFVADRQPPLSILPRLDGSYVLAYQLAMSDGYFYLAGADAGTLLHRVRAFKSQSAVGAGADSTGIRRKLSTTRGDAGFGAYDRMRPAELVTLDTRFNPPAYPPSAPGSFPQSDPQYDAARTTGLDIGRHRDGRG